MAAQRSPTALSSVRPGYSRGTRYYSHLGSDPQGLSDTPPSPQPLKTSAGEKSAIAPSTGKQKPLNLRNCYDQMVPSPGLHGSVVKASTCLPAKWSG